MKRNIIKEYIQNFNLPLIRIIFVLGIFSTLISCEVEDDIPPPSAWVEPEPVVGCVQLVGVPELSEGIDFECEYPEVGTFGDIEGTMTIEPVDNPDKEGINTSDKVMMVTQSAGVEGWAGFSFVLASKVDFSEKQTIKMKVYSPAEGQTILLKLEDKTDSSISKEVPATTTVANEWEELSFVFSPGDSDKFDRLVLFFNFNGDKGATTVHYFDDIVMAEGGSTGGPGGELEPTNTASDPNVAEDSVISLFSDVYTNVAVDTWRTDWSNATLEDITINGNNVKKYSDLNFVGIETVSTPVDASAMTHFHVDIWTADATEFRIKLVDFGADGAFDGGDDVEHEVVISDLAQQEWVSIDVPLSDFTGLTTQSSIGQLIFVAAPSGQNTTYVDNVFFYDSAGISNEPVSAAPSPTRAEANVISLFSDAYTDVSVATWRTDWSAATLEDISINGNAVKKYSDLNFVGIETGANQIDASEMEYFHMNVWTADASEIRIKLVDFGADGGFDGGDDVEHEITIANPQQNSWLSLEIPLSDFTGLTTKTNIAQIIFAAQPAGSATIFVDNVYFYKEASASTEPQSAAPAPTEDAANVISLFSDVYTDVPVDTWRTDWSAADYTETTVDGDAVKLYSNLSFVGAETISNQVDASAMTHFHVDYWTGNASVFRVKLVDFGPDGGFDGGDDTEHEIEFTVTPNTWVSLDIPLSDFTGLTTTQNISQYIFSAATAGEANVYIDNVYFHN